MRFLIIGKCFENQPNANFQKLQEAEGKALWELYGAGILREALFGKQMNCLSFVFECRSYDEANQFIKTLPSAKSELIDYQVSEMTGFPSLAAQFTRHHSKLPTWLC